MSTESTDQYFQNLSEKSQENLREAITRIVEVKKRNGKIMIVTGSGPNIHEGVTTLIAELMGKDIIDSVTTSSAVIAHEMGGSLDNVKRISAADVGFNPDSHFLPKGGVFELSLMSDEAMTELGNEMVLDNEIIQKAKKAEGDIIIKAAGNMAYPMGLYCENLSNEILTISQTYGLPFETVAGWGADRKTMLGMGALKGKPVLVTVPQLIGGGNVGLSIADSIPVSRRSALIAEMIDEADIIIESAVALTQEIHDGPFECYTGHGIWAYWNGLKTCSLKGKTLIRLDMDENLMKAKEFQDENKKIQTAIDKGLPKTKITGIPFRMEMSAFARLEDSIPVIGDIGELWPIIAAETSEALDISLDFMSYPQQTEQGKKMRDWIVDNVKPINRSGIINELNKKDQK
ncbi:MAG: hypothetical protein DRP70_07135 [Spirochaetes bacterium]|nr:MAG: hypothetical protein DRP70_07135 [Spirochaetota bacterium]